MTKAAINRIGDCVAIVGGLLIGGAVWSLSPAAAVGLIGAALVWLGYKAGTK